MTHHHKLPAPTPVTDRPTCAGEWEFTGITVEHTPGRGYTQWGFWERVTNLNRRVTVTENPVSGRMCRELQMGGSVHCGLEPWSGQWRRA